MKTVVKQNFSQLNVINFPRPCTLCTSQCNVSMAYGLWVCSSCIDNIENSNTSLYVSNSPRNTINF